MSIFSYQLSRGQTRWQFTIDLPPAADGRRRQMNRKGFLRQEDAIAAETEARKTYARADLAADGTLAAELEQWLGERELDVQETTLGNYRDIVRCYVLPHLGSRQVYTLNKRAIHDLYKTLLTRGSKRGGPLSRTTVGNVHRCQASDVVPSGRCRCWLQGVQPGGPGPRRDQVGGFGVPPAFRVRRGTAGGHPRPCRACASSGSAQPSVDGRGDRVELGK